MKYQALIQSQERFTKRVALSEYRDHFILKGGMLVSSLLGVNLRATMDIDTTVKALPLTEYDIERIVNEIVAIQFEDNISFTITKIETIINRSISNTRMRDFYDIHELASLVGYDEELAQKAFVETCKKKNTIFSKDKGPVIRRIEE